MLCTLWYITTGRAVMNNVKSLVEARKEFSTQIKCEEHLARMRWPNGVTCPRCGSRQVKRLSTRRQWQCKCRYQFSVTAGTVFHKTHIDLPRWMIAVWLVCHSPKGVSSKQIQRELGVTYKTAWYMTRRIRGAIQNTFAGITITGTVEIDEAVIHADGGKAGGHTPFNTKDVLAMFSRDSGAIRMIVLERLWRADIERICTKNFKGVHTCYTDAANRLLFLRKYGKHKRIKHFLGYADGETHVNNVESAWSLFKRGLLGVYHHVSAKHLQGVPRRVRFQVVDASRQGRKDENGSSQLLDASAASPCRTASLLECCRSLCT
jgi:transposase-like protein